MVDPRRRSIAELSLREYSLYRAIWNELEDLEQSILYAGVAGTDFEDLASSMMDRRLLVGWLRELEFPPSSDYADTGLTAAVEEQIIAEALD